jgi:transposase InsO family protein
MQETYKWQANINENNILSTIREVINNRPTYGYRRVTAILNANYSAKINHKRVYRVMKDNNLLLAKYGPKPIRAHTGNIVTLHSNTRWCSDGFVITCDNGDRVHVAFAMDTCDREALRYIASTKGIDGGMIRDLMAESVLYRFGSVNKLPKAIQWLSDNGSCYTARETVRFGRELGFEICTTPPYSPESNGMAEALVKTLKRDYVYLGDLSCAEVVFKQLPKWFADYNENAPHKGLKMLSPRQYINAIS